MKKFRIVRNVLIICIIVIAVMYMFLIRSNNVYDSASYKLYKSMYDYNHKDEKKQITMETAYSDENINFVMVQSTDDEAKIEAMYMSTNYTNDVDHRGNSITVKTNEGTKTYSVLPEEKKYRIIYENNNEKATVYNEWVNVYLSKLENCTYYTKGYEMVNGDLLYFENFKESGMKLYFNKNELTYMKLADLDENFNNVKDVLYNIKITYDDTYKEFIDIPNDYTEYEVN